MYMNNNLAAMGDNITPVQEDDWSIINSNTDIWEGELPYKKGTKFPTDDIKERASISKTNELIYNNEIEEIATNILSIYPEIDPMYGWQIREIIAKLPYFKNATNAWVGLVSGDAPSVDISDEVIDEQIDQILEASNFASTIQNEVRSRFLDIISAYRVDTDLNGKPVIINIRSKNLIIFVNKEYINSIEVCVVWGTYKKDGQTYIDFVEYHYDGYIKKSTFEYNNEILGDLVSEEEDHAFGGKYNVSPIIVFKHNVLNDNDVYGTDQYRYWSSSMLAGMREMQNILRIAERTRELIRKVPDSAIKKNNVDGSSVFVNKGTIGYTETGEGKSPDIEYVVPEIRMEEAIQALEKAIDQIAMDTQLGTAFFNINKLGARLSADSIRAALLPARLEAKRISTEMKDSIKELVIKLGLLAGINVEENKMNLTFYDGFPRDELNDIKAVQIRLESETPSITLEDAIMKLDHVSLRIAKQKAAEIRQAKLEDKGIEKIKDEPEKQHLSDNISDNFGVNSDLVEDAESFSDITDVQSEIVDDTLSEQLYGTELKPTAGSNEDTKTGIEQVDDTVWENQFYQAPRDIKQKGLLWRQLRRKA